MTTIESTAMELEPVATPVANLFAATTPTDVLEAAQTVAQALKAVLDSNDMVVRIRSKGRVSEHVTLDGWETAGAMLGISPHVIWSRPITVGEAAGWEARAEARTVDGRVVGAAEAMCLDSEGNWKKSEPYAIRSMAQTRAMSKAMSAPLRFVVTLAGKSGTPAEEAPEDGQPYGPSATDAETAGFGRAVHGLWTDPATGEVKADPAPTYDRIVADAGGYLPRIVARAVMYVAAHNPNDPAKSTARPAEQAGTGGDSEQPEDAPDDDGTPPDTQGNDANEGGENPDAQEAHDA